MHSSIGAWQHQTESISVTLECHLNQTKNKIQGGSEKKLILSEYVNKTENIGGTLTNTKSYRENKALSDIFTGKILLHSCFMFKYSMSESSQ